ncbi:MAG: protease modulator HflC, partial [Sphingobium sp.]|nr:protease modulator HflC [Sphingobium sp.]
YRYTFSPDRTGQTNIILSPNNEFLQQFQGRK